MKHYSPNPQLGMRLAKMGMNKVMRQLTFGDDIQIFEDSVMLTPVTTYWQYTSDKLSMFKSRAEDSLFEIYLNTYEGPKIGFAKLYSLALDGVNIALIAFPFESQTEKLKEMIKEVVLEINDEEEKKEREKEGRVEGKKKEVTEEDRAGNRKERQKKKNEEEEGEKEKREEGKIKKETRGKRTKNMEEWEKLLKLYFYRYRKMRKIKKEDE